jgi:hypothetical protein
MTTASMAEAEAAETAADDAEDRVVSRKARDMRKQAWQPLSCQTQAMRTPLDPAS